MHVKCTPPGKKYLREEIFANLGLIREKYRFTKIDQNILIRGKIKYIIRRVEGVNKWKWVQIEVYPLKISNSRVSGTIFQKHFFT